MCWNADISLNTFIFSVFALILIYISNAYTPYTIEGFEGPFYYFYFFLFVSIQLVEYGLWKNLNNKRINRVLSKIGLFLIFSQMFFSIFIAESIYQPYLFAYFFIFVVTFYVYKTIYSPIHFITTVSPRGHLSWEWLRFTGYEKLFILVGFSFYMLPLLLSTVNQKSIYLTFLSFLLTYLLFICLFDFS